MKQEEREAIEAAKEEAIRAAKAIQADLEQNSVISKMSYESARGHFKWLRAEGFDAPKNVQHSYLKSLVNTSTKEIVTYNIDENGVRITYKNMARYIQATTEDWDA